MDQNELIATFIPMYQVFLASKISEQQIAAKNLRPTTLEKEVEIADESAGIDEVEPADISAEADDFIDDFEVEQSFEIEQSDDEEGDVGIPFSG
jgi:hypothetical protein